MGYDVQIVADSVSPSGQRITTFQLRYPRMIHSEVMTHRAFSRNASSTRTIPTGKLIEWIRRDPAMPVYWGKNQKGMQAGAELTPAEREAAEDAWLRARDQAVDRAEELIAIGVHKQIAGRILEPWAHINVVITATSFDNFFALRCDPAAMPEIQALAVRMARLYRDNKPVSLDAGWWHLPFLTPRELGELCRARLDSDLIDVESCQRLLDLEARSLKLSVARCARVSYLTFGGVEPSPAADEKLHDRLLKSGHWSPFEHQARCMGGGSPSTTSGNLSGWKQYRQSLLTSVHRNFDFDSLDRYGAGDFILPEGSAA